MSIKVNKSLSVTSLKTRIKRTDQEFIDYSKFHTLDTLGYIELFAIPDEAP